MPKRLSLVGQKFGRLAVIKDVGSNRQGRSQFLCKCGCGNETIVFGSHLENNHTRSCGCLQREKRGNAAHRLNLVGKRFGRLVVLKDDRNDKTDHSQWICQCDCGNEVIVVGCSLTNGDTKSCGCLRKEQMIEYNKRNKNSKKGKNNPSYKHGLTRTRSYKNQMNSKHRAKKKNQTPSDANLKKLIIFIKFAKQ